MTTTLYHGSRKQGHVAHEGICLTRESDVAELYAGSRGYVYECQIDLDSLCVERCSGYDHDTDYAQADDAEYRTAAAERGVDLLTYGDEDERGQWHRCYRLISAAAVAACVLTVCEPA